MNETEKSILEYNLIKEFEENGRPIGIDFVNSPMSPKILNFNFREDDSDELSLNFSQLKLNCQKGGETNATVCLDSFLKYRHSGYSKKCQVH